jgi:hypothetical protein
VSVLTSPTEHVLPSHPFLSYYKGRYGGYAGEASPERVYDLLTAEDNIFLVDIRTEETREKEGLPQLKLGARYKVAAFPVQVGGVHLLTPGGGPVSLAIRLWAAAQGWA